MREPASGAPVAKSKQMATQLGVPKGKHGADARNALLHCYWSCRMSVTCGNSESWSAGILHEITGSLGITTQNTPGERDMDIYNNKEGRECSELPCGLKSCESCCLGKFKSGELQKNLTTEHQHEVPSRHPFVSSVVCERCLDYDSCAFIVRSNDSDR